jgi:hypothetical protein
VTSALEQQLAELGAWLEVPPAPDPAAIVAALPDRDPSARRRSPRQARRVLVPAIVITLVLGAGAAFAVPASRHAILRVLGLQGERIERAPTPTPFPPAAARRLHLGRRIPLAHARRAAGFTALITPRASAAYLAHDLPGGRITLVAGRVLVVEFRGDVGELMLKVVGPSTHHRLVRVNGGQGAYLYGAPHELIYLAPDGSLRSDTVRLAGNVLVWQQGRLTIRIEGTKTLAQALALARTLR